MISDIEIIIRLLIAALLGFVIGFERERHDQPAGLRTHMILVTGSALAMTLSINLAIQLRPLVLNGDPARLAAQVVSGIGFLGAGAILRFGTSIKGLTTATSLWTMAIVGLTIGAGQYVAGIAATVLLLITLTLLNMFGQKLIPSYQNARVLIDAQDRPALLQEIRTALEQPGHQIHSFGIEKDFAQGCVEIDINLRVAMGETIEQVMDLLTSIQGVDRVKIS